MPGQDLYSRYKRALFVGLGAGALIYLAFSLYAELPRVLAHLATFRWWLLVPILSLSLLNYFIRFLRWEYYLRRLGVRLAPGDSLSVFLAGLSMTITPGKAGELLKSLLLKELSGTPVARTLPVVVAERVTDLLGLILLAAVGIGTWYPTYRPALALAAGSILAVVAVLNNQRLSLGILELLARLPGVSRLAQRLHDLYAATATLLGLRPLLLGLCLATSAWFMECLGYYSVFQGHGVDASLKVATFLYAFSTIAGVISPGGLGVTDLSLGKGAQLLIPGLSASLAVSAAFIIRVSTLWFAVLVGSLALLRFKATASGLGGEPVGSPPSPSSQLEKR